jgi:hypothetical protein
MVSDDRAQAFTLEGFIAAVLVLSALLFALQSIVITPSTGGEIGGQTERSLQQQSGDVLAVNAESGNLSRVVRYWDDGCGAVNYHNASSVGYDSTTNITDGKYALGTLLNETFEERGRPFNVVVEYHTNSSKPGWEAGQTRNATIFRQGAARETSITTSYTVVLYDDQELTAPPASKTLGEADECPGEAFAIPDASPNSEVYNVVTVRVTLL